MTFPSAGGKESPFAAAGLSGPGPRRASGSKRVGRERRTEEGPLVLVVDDLADQRDLYSQYLRFCGYEVATAVNGRDALDKVEAVKPDAIVMDLSMPLMDGFEATRALKSDAQTRHIPVIALTGYATYLPEDWALSVGCAAYLSKPCLPADLAGVVGRLLGTRRR